MSADADAYVSAVNLDLRVCNRCGEVGYLRKTGCLRTTCQLYYLRKGQTSAHGPWTRGSGSSDRAWTWAEWERSSTASWAHQQRLVSALQQANPEELISSDDESEPEQSSKRATVAKAVEVLLLRMSGQPRALNPKP